MCSECLSKSAAHDTSRRGETHSIQRQGGADEGFGLMGRGFVLVRVAAEGCAAIDAWFMKRAPERGSVWVLQGGGLVSDSWGLLQSVLRNDCWEGGAGREGQRDNLATKERSCVGGRTPVSGGLGTGIAGGTARSCRSLGGKDRVCRLQLKTRVKCLCAGISWGCSRAVVEQRPAPTPCPIAAAVPPSRHPHCPSTHTMPLAARSLCVPRGSPTQATLFLL